ncbi:MAG: hypothetical protein QXU89_01790 [Desulfurococcaceae archaeon]
MDKLEIYLCEYNEIEQFFTRHYVTSISKCVFIKETDLGELREKMPRKLVDQLINDKEIVVTDEELIEKLVGKQSIEKRYVYLLIRF